MEAGQAWNLHIIASATFCGQNKSQGQPRFKGREICSQLMMGGAARVYVG